MREMIKRNLYRLNNLEIQSRLFNPNVESFDMDADFRILTLTANVRIVISIKSEKFTIEWKDHLRVLTFFETVLDWFYNEKMKDIFYRSENGDLCFNADYNKLSSMVYSNLKHEFLQAKPTLVQRDKTYEGIILCVNKVEASICLTVRELLEVTSILQYVNFSTEANLLLSVMKSIHNGNFSSQDNQIANKTVKCDPFNLGGRFDT